MFEHDLFQEEHWRQKMISFFALSARLTWSHKTDSAVLVIFLIYDSLWRCSHSPSWTSSFHEVYKRELLYLKTFYVYLKAGTVASRSLLEEAEGKVHRQGGLPRTCLKVFFLFFCPIQDVYFKTMVIATVIHSLSGKSGKFAEEVVRSCQAILCVHDGDQVISNNIIIAL